MKLVDVSEFFAERGGGVRTYVEQKLRAGTTLGHEVVIIAPGPEDRDEPRLGGRVLWVRSRPMPVDPRYYALLDEKAVHALLAREAPDVIEGSSPWTSGWFAARYRAPAGVTPPRKSFVFHQDPVAVYGHTLLSGMLGDAGTDRLFAPYWSYLGRLSSAFDVTVVAGQWLAHRLSSLGVRHPIAVPFGIDKAPFLSALPDPGLRAELLAATGAPKDASLLVTVSRHHPEKRLFTLIEAVRRANRERPVGLVIYGDGPLRPLVERAARRSHVHVAGITRDRDLLARALRSADALLHGSAAETFGLVVAEALCAGLPLIVPDRGGASELAQKPYAETYPAGDATACATAIVRLLSRYQPALHAAAEDAGRTTVADERAHFEHLFATYAQLLSQR